MSPNPSHGAMSFALPPSLLQYLKDLDSFITSTITPLQNSNDNKRFFDHRREHSRTDWDKGGLPTEDWEALLSESRQLADKAGFYRFCLPTEYGGQNGGNLWMAVIRIHLAKKGLGLFNDLQNEHSIVGNFPDVLMVREFGTVEQKKRFIKGRLEGRVGLAFGLTERGHGSDATHMRRRSIVGNFPDVLMVREFGTVEQKKRFIKGRLEGRVGLAFGLTERGHGSDATHMSTFAERKKGKGGEDGLRQAASSLGAAMYCIEESVKYARTRKPFGKELASNQGIQFPLVELATQAEMLQLLILKTATEMDKMTQKEIERDLGDKVSMCNYWGNRLCTQAADRAMQVHGGIGYSRHKPFEHIYRHHRRYRITEGSEEIQMRKIAAYLFGFVGPRKAELSKL
ncbi:uncharacterized protein PAC_05906 [Phialocephala subalpina]|uniref:Acyl-CoA dehydrogenase n=1 Tax=Phialocephala subalpina TaxID=576137 RepID=A0A1L7WTA3_9HELO|nr:uncharacterized protein PAC_05906 [Phialocephala subalpina]